MILAVIPLPGSATEILQWVDPFIGTSGTGHTFPGACYPFGFIQLSPDTGNGEWAYCAGYQYEDTRVRGFSHTHMSGGGIADLGDVSLLPFSDRAVLRPASWGAVDVAFSKDAETAAPGYYRTVLPEDGIRVELTATEHTGLQRYTFTRGGAGRVWVSIDRILFSWGDPEKRRVQEGAITVEDDYRLSGWYKSKMMAAREVFFALQFDQPIVEHRSVDGDARRQLILDFGELEAGGEIRARCAISTVSVEGARKNLEAESAGQSFDTIRSAAEAAWSRYLSRVRIDGTEAQKKQIYSSLYRLCLQPNNIADVDGRYRGGDREIHVSETGNFYSTIALWDIYRAAFPLYTILTTEKVPEFTNSLLAHYDQVGYLPVWPLWGADSQVMIGNHAVAVVTDAVLKGFEGISPEHAFEAVKATLTRNHWRKYDWALYDAHGYIPSDRFPVEAVSSTLEAAFDDSCAARLAEALGKGKDRTFFASRAQYFRNLYDARSGFMRGRSSDGKWVEPFDPLKISHAGAGGDYTEGNAWQYLWSVQHDIPALVALLGGPAAARERLDTFFSLPPEIYGDGSTLDVSGLIGQYAHGNEPSQHVIYLYNYVGRPERTQELVRQVIETLYAASPQGLPGNDDFGQMSAWYVLSSLGFYPVDPASGRFNLGVPAFPYAELDVNGNVFSIRAEGFGPENRYVGKVTLNGVPVLDHQISYQAIMRGGELVFEMMNRPQAAR